MFDLHKEFILCTYSGRLEEIKKKKKIQISFTYLEYFLRELRQSSLGQWGTSVPLSYFCQCSARCRKPSSVLISVAVLLWFEGNTAGIVPVKSFQNVRQQRTYLMEVWRAFDNVDTIPTHPQRTWYLEGCFVKQDWMNQLWLNQLLLLLVQDSVSEDRIRTQTWLRAWTSTELLEFFFYRVPALTSVTAPKGVTGVSYEGVGV